jgi:hypothetical protein
MRPALRPIRAGGMQTGYGGTAPRASLGSDALLPVGLALLVFIALAGLLRVRRPLSLAGPRSSASRNTQCVGDNRANNANRE